MAEFVPCPFDRLVSRMFREFEKKRSIFDLEERRFVLDPGGHDLSVRFHGKEAATPLGPAAGPQSQLAQNLLLSFLGGGRVFELKTVQIQDRLQIPRPCIDMQTVGYNVEWSQELRLEQSLEEYIKGSMLIEILIGSGALPLAPNFGRFLFDMSVGYDLAGIRSERVAAFLRGMRDARPIVDRLRRQIPAPWRRLRDLDFRTDLSESVTLSTFHGCPPAEIEGMVNHLLEDHRLHCVVKLNPTLLGAQEARRIFNEVLGYTDRIPVAAFEKDTRWPDAVDFVGRLQHTAQALGLGFGVKLTNTLIVENRRDFFPSTEREMYLSGPPLHVLAVALVDRFRTTFGAALPISFSAGINQRNFPDAVALGLCPVTVCSDLLRPRGYGRMQGYFTELSRRMEHVSARTIDEWIARYSAEPAASPREAAVENTRRYAAALLADPRYRREANAKPPRKVGSPLHLLDCLTCDLCVPVCPNDANFTFTLPPLEIPVTKLQPRDGSFLARTDGTLAVRERHQIGNVADFCNECGNCDVFCPEDGGPYLVKPRFFGTLDHWRRLATHDGFHVERREDADIVHGRFGGREYLLELSRGLARYAGAGFDLRFAEGSPEQVLAGSADAEVDLTYFHLMNLVRRAILDASEVTFLNASQPSQPDLPLTFP